MEDRITIAPGYYGLALVSVYTSSNDVPEASRRVLDALPPGGVMFVPAVGEYKDGFFYVLQKLQTEGVIVSAAAHNLRSDDPAKALSDLVGVFDQVADKTAPVSVMWLESFGRLFYH